MPRACACATIEAVYTCGMAVIKFDQNFSGCAPMQLTFEIPDALVERLRSAVGDDLARAAIEQIAREGYEAGKLSHFEIQQLLGFNNRWDTEQWLVRHRVRLNYSLKDLQDDRVTLDHLLGE